ncbi:MAG: hypothetical protein KC420_22930, partial [Myxococcales bacterium]|nr:hypothetical protein [Myxococcales bacterium]
MARSFSLTAAARLGLVVASAGCGDDGVASDSETATATATATTTAATLTAGESDGEVGSDSGTATSGTTGATGDPAVLLHLGDDLDPAIAARVEAHIAAASPLPVVVVPSDETIAAPAPGSLVLSVGDTPST